VGAILTAVGSLLYQKHRMELDRKEFSEKYDSHEKRVSRWLVGLPHPLPPPPDENSIDVGQPYQAGAPIRNAELFYGRQEQLSSAMNCVTGEDMASMFILGARKSGKTSFFYYMSHILSPDHYPQIVPVYLDTQIPISGDKNFYAYMLRETSTVLAARSKSNSHPPEIPREVEFDSLCTFLEQASAKGWRFVFLLDEFKKLVENKQISGEDFFASLRSLILKANISWIPASFQAVYMPGTNTSPFINIIQETSYLGPLSELEARLLVSEPAARAGHKFDNEDIELILDLAGRMPFLLQKASLLLYMAHRAREDRQVARTHLDTTFKLESQIFFQSQLSILSPQEREALFRLALHQDVTKYSQILKSMENYGFVEMKTGGYQVLGRTFDDYLYQKAKETGLAAS
jgi:hypothetical protein